jgi:SAM-dependent methyltransferase
MAGWLLYRSERAYLLVMRALYGRHYEARYRALADLIAPGAEVLDLCCGPGILYRRYLRPKGVDYRGLDINPRFVARLRSLDVRAEQADLRGPAPLPRADVVVMQASLYHFLPDPEPVLARMLASARRQVLIAEPVRNLSSSRFGLIAALGRHATGVAGAGSERFDEASLDALMDRYADRVERRFLIPGGREKVYLLRPPSASPR